MQDKTKIFNTALNLQMAGNATEALKLYLKLIKTSIFFFIRLEFRNSFHRVFCCLLLFFVL